MPGFAGFDRSDYPGDSVMLIGSYGDWMTTFWEQALESSIVCPRQ
jgi:hypothetical protein